jgi:ATP-dependent RNA helicase HelY
LDRFQLDALDALDVGESVLVAAPTGSGKTVVADYAIAAALADGRRAFYTAPIKALSNQKYGEFVAQHGATQVGLLTGDVSVNGEAPVVVMTTEVLRNMIYGRSHQLSDLAVVVLDEVHFLQDAYRGPVWEEVIIHLPAPVRLVCLSATVSNADEVAEWISTVRGTTRAVVETRRPVRLDSHYLVGDRATDTLHLMPVLVGGRPNQAAARLEQNATRGWQGGGRRGGPGVRRRLFTPSRLDVIERLRHEDLLPAIYFIFSRNQCDEAARACLAAGFRLTAPDEREHVREILDERLGHLHPDDLAALNYAQLVAQLEGGIAAHHAGMVPPFKEAVEQCFAAGLTKVVFATETLAVGVNMPARAVVIEKLTKFTGERHASLTAAEFTQLTGRAGRRGIDDEGHAVVLWSPFVPFEQVAALVANTTYRLQSAFRPTYNMAANLVRTYTSEQAHHLLNLSFAQFQSDRELVHLEARMDRRRQQLDELRRQALSPHGDVEAYRRELERRQARSRERDHIRASLAQLRPGDVVYLETGRRHERAVVLTSAHRSGGIRVTFLDTRAQPWHVNADDLDEPLWTVGHVSLPEPYAPNRNDFRKEAVRRLLKARLAPRRERRRAPQPVEADPDLDQRVKASKQADRIDRELRDLQERAAARQGSVARRFDDLLGLLQQRGFIDGWSLTPAGEILARVFHECDLLVAETVRAGLLDGLDPATTAGLVSVFVYEHRSPEPAPAPWFPSRDVERRFHRIQELSTLLRLDEDRLGLTAHRPPDPTFLAVAHGWALGEDLADLLEEEELSGGDFVRTMRQLLDLLRQLALVAPSSTTRDSCHEAAQRLHRGVVAASGPVTA